ncbi:hypothetical protein HK405_015515 [Cladochytrium tenue]|nr:hypothetical protein HK405_015515 [Cladochytrium tenue]
MNYIEEENTALGRPLNEINGTRQYMLTRAITFLSLASNECSANESGVHAPHFMFESLQRIVNLTWEGLGPTGYATQVIQYEDTLQQHVFSWVEDHYGELRAAYVKHFDNHSLATISSVRDANAHFLNPGRIDFDFLKQKRLAQGFESHILDKFMNEVIDVVDIIPMIPKFIKMYKILNSVFGDRLTKDEIRLPVPKCLELVASRVNADENARFEADIIQVDNNTALADLVTESSDSVDAVMRVIESLRGHQRLFEDIVTNRRDTADDALWTDEIDANWLPLDNGLFLGSLLSRKKWEAVMLSAIIDSIYGLPKIELSLRTTFRVINDDFEAIHVVETGAFDPITFLKQLVRIIKPSSRLAVPLAAQERVRVEAAFRRQSEEKLVSAADTLSILLKALVVDHKAFEKIERTSTLSSAIVNLAPTMKVSLTEALPLEMRLLQMKNVKDIAEMVIEIVDGKGHLFTWLPVELDRPLSLEAASFLSEKLSDLSSDYTEHFQRSMRSLSVHLNEKVDYLRPRVGTSLLRTLRAAAHETHRHEWDDCWTEVLSEVILVENLGAFLRFLFKYGSLANAEGESILYRERVPDRDAAAQGATAMEVDSEPTELVEETQALALAGVLESDMIAMREMADNLELAGTRNFHVKPRHRSMFLSAMLQCLIAVDSAQTHLSVPGDTESPLSGPIRRILQESRRPDDSVIDPAELMRTLKGLDTKYTGRRDILVYTLFQDLLKFHAGLARLVTIRRTVRVVCEECGATSESEESANCVDVPVGNSGDISIDAAIRGFFASKTYIERFVQEDRLVKLLGAAVVPPFLTPPHCDEGKAYKLKAEHHGPLDGSGYFTATVYSKNVNNWLLCKDAHCDKVPSPCESSSEGEYLLFYELGPKEDVESASEPMGHFQQTGTSTSLPEVPTLAATVSGNAGKTFWVSVLDEDKEAEFAARVLEASNDVLDAELPDPEELPVQASVGRVSALKRLLAEDRMFAARLASVDPARMRVYRSASDFFESLRRRVDPTAAPTDRGLRGGRGDDGCMPSRELWLPTYGEHAEDPVVVVIPRRN